MKKYYLIKLTIITLLFSITKNVSSQDNPFTIELKSITIPELGGLQSYAFGQANGKWLLVGGRLDGLHRRQPWAAFDLAGHNNQLIVVDPVAKLKWTAALESLPSSVQEQLSSTNMEFYQEGNYLYIIGGYGYSPTIDDHTTFDNLTAINVPEVIDAIISETDFSNSIVQLKDSEFQVTGGKLEKIDDVYYLLGGHKFIGRYNPMGPNHGPGFIQEYTNAIRKFNLSNDGSTITVNHLEPHIDEMNLHRRDYNAEPQILENRESGIIMYSGVFQQDEDLPFLNSVTVTSDDYYVNDSFEQMYNHYHCPALPLYSEENNEMHTVFFGGIAQFYDSLGTLVQDDDVPFVNTIAKVTRDKNGKMTETKLPIVMPSLLGAGAEFIPNPDFPHFDNNVFKLDSLSSESTLVGFIFGGIQSSQPNIFFINNGTQSTANSEIYEVYLKKNSTSSVENSNRHNSNDFNLSIYPNPTHTSLFIDNIDMVQISKITIIDLEGRVIETNSNIAQQSKLQIDIKSLNSGVYFLRISVNNKIINKRFIID
jgi:hypothetical protein